MEEKPNDIEQYKKWLKEKREKLEKKNEGIY
jgi:hypothetical protein